MLKPVLNGMVSAEKFGQMRTMAFEVVALFVLRGAATFGSTLTLSRIGNRIVATAQRRVFDRLLNQNVMFFQDRHSSEFVARLVIAANGVRDTLQLVVQSGARDLLTVVGLGSVMIYQDPLVASGAVCALPIRHLLHPQDHRQGARLRQALVRRLDPDHADDERDGARRAHHQGVQPRSEKCASAWRARCARSKRSANRIAAGNGLTAFLADSLAGLAIGFAVYYGSWRVSVQHADVGSFVSFLGALLLAYEPAKRLSGFWVNLQNGMVGARMIYEVLDAPLGDAPRSGAPRLEVTRGATRRSKAPASPTDRASTRSTASISSPSPARRPRWSAPRAAASRRFSASSSVSTR